jgi:hypothetical protein
VWQVWASLPLRSSGLNAAEQYKEGRGAKGSLSGVTGGHPMWFKGPAYT